MVRARGTYFIVGYGGELRVPTFNLVLPGDQRGGQRRRHPRRPARAGRADRGGRGQPAHPPYPLDAFADAIADLEHGRMHGRGVLVP